ncbi:biotin synthase [Friedmanniomyces endolithicus]|uniref:biotin synthase n=1 Tax=Friedmanniomyces endolithicus TaxID=329885 RepID=A0AAN6H2X6_9PEZI|nr:biotin synthase [Friedmanniomyces endolithicus]KAK0783283.1 biotin synthase [Friedmanniomyces endolithicus]KAK0786321.1 biotin synthase [Friedmanniomyces endolithicus]KAK0835072.1 biotin synthase [Friedmanniomyces endolithicus]KAK0840280.1 biotin synthase [Friedmanniomyces endolithicus]
MALTLFSRRATARSLGSCTTIRAFSTPVNDTFPPSPSAPPPPPEASHVLRNAVSAQGTRYDWTRDEIRDIYNTPLMELAFQSATLHRRFHRPSAIQMCTLMNIKTGGCSEDCSYCAQSSRYNTGLTATKMSSVDSVLEAARIAKSNGSTRFCMGAAWRDMRGRKTSLKNVKSMIEGVRAMDLEVCVTLGMIDQAQAEDLAQAGLTAYNHNLDTSREHYPSVISTRTYDERLQTLSHVRQAGINVCSGGILGLGETPEDHVGLIHTVSTLPQHPESFPVNALVPIKGTPLGDKLPEGKRPIPFDAILRTIATARLTMPATIIRIAAGRTTMSEAEQILCFSAGANAVFTGEKMLTTEAVGWDTDKAMFEKYGLVPMKSFERGELREMKGKLEASSWRDVKDAAEQDGKAVGLEF